MEEETVFDNINVRHTSSRVTGSSFYPLPTGLVKNPKAHSLTYCLLPIFNKVLGYSTLFDRIDLQPQRQNTEIENKASLYDRIG